ncbi:serine/threonine-protein phosphatase [Streptomyces sp. XM83C]|uniref:SpoIIE family protein phosphatase n=1 Tax=Streptomyces thermocoprophilus TaxID=78356 RepID=A0ABV5VE14_9ACTN|nr:SpoIIE family protein phosphatase [Streptomyces sp. XM83C]MCK1820790.1 serine/threonine-protein phosphatase [Streptomyces sp. XM83C]
MFRIRLPLRPPPTAVAGLRTAAAQIAADGTARGGDLYDVVATRHGVRAVMGDVRGHGIAARGTAAAVLTGFRDAAPDEPDLGRLLRRLDRALARHLRTRAGHPAPGPDPAAPDDGEEFVTLVLLEISGDGTLRALDCGHPWPHRVTGTRVEPLSRSDPLPPLGLFPLPEDLPVQHPPPLLPGELLVLHTDGVEDARDSQGRFFPLRDTLARAARTRPVTPEAVVGTVLSEVRRHAAGRPTDDMALLALGTDPAPPPPEPRPGRHRPATRLERNGA